MRRTQTESSLLEPYLREAAVGAPILLADVLDDRLLGACFCSLDKSSGSGLTRVKVFTGDFFRSCAIMCHKLPTHALLPVLFSAIRNKTIFFVEVYSQREGELTVTLKRELSPRI